MLTILVHRMSRSLVLIHQSRHLSNTTVTVRFIWSNAKPVASCVPVYVPRWTGKAAQLVPHVARHQRIACVLSLSHASVSRRSLSSSLGFRAGIQGLATTVCEDSGDESTTRICRRTTLLAIDKLKINCNTYIWFLLQYKTKSRRTQMATKIAVVFNNTS